MGEILSAKLLELRNRPTFLLYGPAGARDRVHPLVVGFAAGGTESTKRPVVGLRQLPSEGLGARSASATAAVYQGARVSAKVTVMWSWSR